MNLKSKLQHLYISAKASIKKMWFALFKKKLQIINVHIHAPVAIANSLNYIEWQVKNMSHCYVKTRTKNNLVSGSRYYFYNDAEHQEVTLLLKGYNTIKTHTYKLKYLSINKKQLSKPEIIPNVKTIKNIQIKVNNFKKLALPTLVLNDNTLSESKILALESIELLPNNLNETFTNQSYKI
ncbi:hypothetical protein [uncultured Algibacter sp.]|uniref:hypothetical protein n=1 Tax=uncultured Algibacter sp. TaxID=298659 RepID=UPI003217813A